MIKLIKRLFVKELSDDDRRAIFQYAASRIGDPYGRKKSSAMNGVAIVSKRINDYKPIERKI